MVKFILDMDLTLLDSSKFFSNSSVTDPKVLETQNSPEFQKSLGDLPAYPWVLRWKPAIQEASEVIVITGRGEHLIAMSKAWIEAWLGLTFFKMISVPYTTYEEYAMEKSRVTIMELHRMVIECAGKEVIHVIDDNDKVIHDTLVYSINLDACKGNVGVHQVFKGIMVKMMLRHVHGGWFGGGSIEKQAWVE